MMCDQNKMNSMIEKFNFIFEYKITIRQFENSIYFKLKDLIKLFQTPARINLMSSCKKKGKEIGQKGNDVYVNIRGLQNFIIKTKYENLYDILDLVNEEYFKILYDVNNHTSEKTVLNILKIQKKTEPIKQQTNVTTTTITISTENKKNVDFNLLNNEDEFYVLYSKAMINRYFVKKCNKKSYGKLINKEYNIIYISLDNLNDIIEKFIVNTDLLTQEKDVYITKSPYSEINLISNIQELDTYTVENY